MDSVTHGVSGAVAALAVAPPEWQAPATAALTISALYPDIDLLYLLKGRDAFCKYHRGWTHSITSALLFAPALGGALYFAWPEHGFWTLAALSFAGVMLHIAFDVITIWGAEFFAPFSKKKISWSLVPSGNLPFIGVLVLGLIAALLVPTHRSTIAAAAFSASLALIAFAAVTKPVAKRRFGRLLAREGVDATMRAVFPARHMPGAWLCVAEGDSHFYSSKASVWRRSAAADMHTLAKAPQNSYIAIAQQLEEAATYSNIVTFPLVSYEAHADSHRVVFTSLRDEMRALMTGDRRRVFKGLVVDLAHDATVVSASLMGSRRT